MLNNLRAANESWVGRLAAALLMGLIVLSFSIFGVSRFLTGLTSTTLAKVGSQSILVDEFRAAYQTQLQRLSAQTHRQVTNEQAHALGVDTGLLDQMTSQKSLDINTAKMQLAASDAMVRAKIFADPSFAGPSGKFDAGRFQSVLQNSGLNETEYVAEQRQRMVTQQIIDPITADIVAPKAYLEALNRTRNETRSIDYFELGAKAAGDIPAPTTQQLTDFFAPRAGAYRAPEYRSLVVLDVEPGDLAKRLVISDADALVRYNALKAKAYTTPERRDVQQITFSTEADANAAAAKLKTGMTFEALAAERKLALKDYDLGTITKGTLFPATDAAAFILAENGVSEPIKNLVGYALIHVAKIIPTAITPFSDVDAKLKSEIAIEKAKRDADVLRDKIEDARTNGKDLKDAAASVGLIAREIPAVDANGLDKDGKPVVGLAQGDPLLRPAFDTAVGVDNETIHTKTGGTEWFELKSVDPARARTLDELHDKIVAAWISDERTKRLRTKTDEIVKKLDSGEKIEKIASEEGNLQIMHIADVQRRGTKDVAEGVAAQAFNVFVGKAGSAEDGDKGRIVFKVLDAVVPALDEENPQNKEISGQLSKLLAADIANQYVGKVKADIGVSVDAALLKQATGNNAP